tara:strand:+ start:570 stop:1259 length:690 start_codon:yes stop_codon:yes gene_type:complete
MNYFDTLEKKRNHVRKYDMHRIVPKEKIERALWKAWKTTPGKNNAMAYQALVWGPDKELEKEAIHRLCVKNQKHAEDRGVRIGLQKEKRTRGFVNIFYEHVKLNPYLISIHSRIAFPNRFYKEQVKKGHFYDQSHNVEHIIDSVAVEVGLFVGNLGYYLLEEGLDISYNSCFKREVKDWHKVGLTMVDQRPIIMVSCGYAKKYRKEELKEYGYDGWDVKPEINEIVKWI